jgi:hypothetical protein
MVLCVLNDLCDLATAKEIQWPLCAQGMPLRKEIFEHSPTVVAAEDMKDFLDARQKLLTIELPTEKSNSPSLFPAY